MLSLNDRQDSKLTMSGVLGTRTVKRDLPPNMREIGDSTDLAYLHPCIIHQQRQTQCRENE